MLSSFQQKNNNKKTFLNLVIFATYHTYIYTALKTTIKNTYYSVPANSCNKLCSSFTLVDM